MNIFRLLVTMANEELFTNAPKNSVLYRISQNNLYTHPEISARSMLESTDLLAYYDSVASVVESQEFKTCLVCCTPLFCLY